MRGFEVQGAGRRPRWKRLQGVVGRGQPVRAGEARERGHSGRRDGGIQWPQANPGSAGSRENRRTGEQGDPGRRRSHRDQDDARAQCRDTPGGLGALGHFPMPARRPGQQGRKDSPHRIRRPVPHLGKGEDCGRHRRAGAQAPELGYGRQGHHRLRYNDEQGFRGHRGQVALRYGSGQDQRGRASRVHHPLDGGIHRRCRHCPDGLPGHA